jgi:curved DNA-binding protein CbpA
MPKTYYDILGLRASATPDEIKRAYRKKAMESHPDVNPTPGAADVFREINEAYAILGDSQKRPVYDQKLRNHQTSSAADAYARNQSRSKAKEEAWKQWVQNAKAQADANARMNYEEFKKSKFENREERVFLYLQFLIVATIFILGALILVTPVVAMFLISWKAVLLVLVLGPASFKIFEEGIKGFKAVKQEL